MSDPTVERYQHDVISREAETVADSEGGIGYPWRVESMLERMERVGDIGPRERLAGEEFGRLFALAHLDPLQAADLSRSSRASSSGPHGAERARRRILEALDTLGGQSSLGGSCAWFVLGNGMSLRAWTIRESWSGKRLNSHNAKGILLGCLGVLARFFGT